MQTPADSQRKPRGRRRFGRPRLLIVGCGDIGLRIVARLRDRFRLIAVTATAQRVVELRTAGTVPIVANLDMPHAAKRLRRIAPWWIHLAPPPAAGPGDPRTRRLRAACFAVDRAVYISTTGVYGDRGGAWLDETATPAPTSERGRKRAAAEAIVRAAPIHASVLRAPGIYAADRLPIERLRNGSPALVAEDDVFTNHIHADDLARLSIAALFFGRPARVYNAVDDTRYKMGDYFDRVADHFGLPRPPRLPRAALKAAVSPAQYSFMSESRRLANRRIKNELRVRLRYPTVDIALAEMARAADVAPAP
jgi:nucleoside-diphosphate-sugar epimerase